MRVKRFIIICSAICIMNFFILLPSVLSDSGAAKGAYDVGSIQVTAEGAKQDFSVSPTTTSIDIDTHQTVDIPQNVGDIIKDLIIFDFRGETNLVPDDDTFQMRSFDASRFVTAIDGLNLRKTGGRKSSHIVDYAFLPPFLIEKIEILPGPHSALYPAKSIGGVMNLVSRAPKIKEAIKPDVSISTSYKSYNTQNHSVSVQGSAKSLTYDLGYQKYASDGYLRNTEADIDTVVGRLGYVFPSGGHAALSASYSDADRGITAINDPSNSQSDYDSDYPVVSKALFYPWQDSSWDGLSYSYRLNYRQLTRIGDLSATGYYSEETRNRSYLSLLDSKDPSKGTLSNNSATRWYQEGAKILDEFTFSDNHITTLEADIEQCYDGNDNQDGDKNRRIRIIGAALQHQWIVLPRLTLTGGLRFEDVSIWVSNSYITGMPYWIERKWDQWLPKSYLTYELDDIGTAFRDTSVSLGVSRIWRAPDYHGDYNPQGRTAGAWLEPEHGYGIDAVFIRRLWSDVKMKFNYSYYVIRDYIASNSTYAKYTPSKTNPVPPGMEYMDYKINLEEMIRHGIELEFTGHIMKDLSFYLGYAFQDLKNQGDEPAGVREASNKARHRINAGLRYNLFKNTQFLLDYKFQDDQVNEIAEELAPDEWIIREEAISAYHLFDFGVRQTLFDKWGPLEKGVFKVYVNNVFDEEYEDSNGYPATDRTFGVGLSFKM